MSLIEVLHYRPDPTAYILLSDHQSTTPVSFFNSSPVLHFRCENCQVISSAELLATDGPFQAVFGSPPNGVVNIVGEAKLEGIDCFVGTNAFILYNPHSQKSISIPYPSISLHALKQEPLLSSPNTKLFKIYLQLSYNSANEDSLEDLLELAVVPLLGGATYITSISPTPTDNDSDMMDVELEQQHAGSTNGSPSSAAAQTTQETLAKALFSSLSKCSNLYPTQQPSNTIFTTSGDGEEYDCEEASLPDGAISLGSFQAGNGFPGEGGWITAENVDQFKAHNNNGNGTTINGGSLGPGAGTVRPREETPDIAGADANGGSEPKWRRTA